MTPAGLDGNPNPIESAARSRLLDGVVSEVRALPGDFVCVAIDGRAGSGKSTLGDELARRLRSTGRPVYRSTTDSFHNPRAVRHRLDLSPAESYYRCSHDLEALRWMLVEPFRSGAGFRLAVFDEPSDRPLKLPEVSAEPGSVLLVDGLFLLRPELGTVWSYSLFLEADRRVGAALEGWARQQPVEKVEAFRARYVEGWALYVRECGAAETADLVIDNNDLEAPRVVRRGSGAGRRAAGATGRAE